MIVIPIVCSDGSEIYVYYEVNKKSNRIVLDRVSDKNNQPMIIAYILHGHGHGIEKYDTGAELVENAIGYKGIYAEVRDKGALIPYYLYTDVDNLD